MKSKNKNKNKNKNKRQNIPNNISQNQQILHTDQIVDYKQSILSFIDILGFRQHLSEDPIELKKAVDMLKKIWQEMTNYPPFIDEKFLSPANSSSFLVSDSIVRVRPLDTYHPFMTELSRLAQSLFILSLEGYFVRGAISHGLVYAETSKNIIVGKPLLQAYQLESNTSIFPRVIIDPKTLQYLETEKTYDECKKAIETTKLIRKDFDGLHHIDYLTPILFFINTDNKEKFNLAFKVHKKFIETFLFDTTIGLKIRQKYMWLANYHNEVLGSTPGYEDLLIDVSSA